MRIFTLLSGIMLTAAGVWCFLKQGTAFVTVALIAGLAVLLLCGCLIAIAFRQKRDGSLLALWSMAEALLDGIAGLLILLNLLSPESSVPKFLGMWLLACGVMRLVPVLLQEGEKQASRPWLLGLSGLFLAAGLYCILDPGWLSPAFLMGIVLIVHGVGIVADGVELVPSGKMVDRLEALRKQKRVNKERENAHEE
ncbi:MAG: DUF308 domain-containing protein [Firmicutes bacterium]|nr:DUF308 domain-containing protein [Bacillota bacterium]